MSREIKLSFPLISSFRPSPSGFGRDFSIEQYRTEKKRQLLGRIKSIYEKNGITSNLSIEITDLRSWKEALSIHPLLLIDPKEIPSHLAKQCFSGEYSEEFYDQFKCWIQDYFGLNIVDKDSFKDALTFFSEIWNHPEMLERVQNLLIEKQIFEEKIYEKAWIWPPGKGWTLRISETVLVLIFIASPFILPVILPLIINFPVNSAILISVVLLTVSVIYIIQNLLANSKLKEHDISFLKNCKDIEALKIVFSASEKISNKNQSFFSKWVPNFLSLKLSLSNRLANMETYANEHNICYIPLPETDLKKIDVFSKKKIGISETIVVLGIQLGFLCTPFFILRELKLLKFTDVICSALIVNKLFEASSKWQEESERKLIEGYNKLHGFTTEEEMLRDPLFGIFCRQNKINVNGLKSEFDFFRFNIPTKYIAAMLGIAVLNQINVLGHAASWINSFWATSSKTFSSANFTSTNFTSGNSAPAKITPGIVSTVPNLSEAVNSCVAKLGPAATLTYEKAKKVFKCFNPLSSVDPTENLRLMKRTYHEFVKFVHPDKGGTNENMLILNGARAVLEKWLKWRR